MKLYREGTLLRDCLGVLWMVTRVYRKRPTLLDYYGLVRLHDVGNSQCECACRVAHLEYDLVAEA